MDPRVTPPSLSEIGRALGRFAVPLVLLGLALALYVGFGIYNQLYIKFLWFDSLGQSPVFWTQSLTPFVVGLVAGVAVLLFLAANLAAILLVLRRAQVNKTERLFLLLQHDEPAPIRPGAIYGLVKWVGVAATAVLALVGAVTASSWWPDVLTFMHGQPFGQVDPILGNDVGFYVFRLPLLGEVTDFAAGYVYLTLLLSGGLYATIYFLFLQEAGRRLTNRPTTLLRLAARHLLTLVACVFAISFAHAQLSNWNLVTGGPTYVQANWNIPFNTVLGLVALVVAIAAVVLAVTGWPNPTRQLQMAAGAYAAWLALIVVLTLAIPGAIQSFVVTPSQLSYESKYINYRLAATRTAFRLDVIKRIGVEAATSPTYAQIVGNPGTLANVRIWDFRKLRDITASLQGIRSYYNFYQPPPSVVGAGGSVAIDRYDFGGDVRQQVMTMARELDPSGLPTTAQSWQSVTLQYTHGFGIAMAAVNRATAEGLPEYLVSNIPPQPQPGVPVNVTRPQIYYGQKTRNYVIVNSGIQELDYSGPTGDVYGSYQGNSGVLLDSSWKRLNFAAYNNEPNIILSHYITSQSRILFHRDIRDRLAQLAPFLSMDADPYIVVSGGRLVWMWDGYATSSNYPYSDPYTDPTTGAVFNYIRNSVKVTIDAYDGSTHIYVSDTGDPIIKTYAAIYPSLFGPLSSMPADLRAHIRYPEQLFMAQVDRYAVYHVRDPQVYFNQGDRWSLPQEQLGPNNVVAMQSYFVTVKVPRVTQGEAEFVQMLPLTPLNKQNMIAWLAARMDAPHYGELVEIDLPRGTNIFGPQQMGSRIQQNTFISSQITLLGQQGSQVGLGNMLVLPIDKAFLYVQPFYVQAQGASFPELKGVIVANNEDVQMASSLTQALAQLYGLSPRNQPLQTGPSPSPPPSPGPSSPAPGQSPSPGQSPTPASGTVAGLVADANHQFQLAEQAAGRGDFVAYGKALQQLQADLNALQQLTKGH